MSIDEKNSSDRQQHSLPQALLTLYSLIAVLIVLVPEWIAGGTLLAFRDAWNSSELPVTSYTWHNFPELRLATMSLAQLRLLASSVHLRNYSRLNRERLISRLSKRINCNYYFRN
uniref:Uncharacterized protein n=1 Tax=Paulinella chromatophora TaxID=39717 RepID=B1X405_PAUCH|nr:hypothetical protein PCC_0225 [Paulinella chromatophora]ACB42674.1 hypothetical protein PCC_0225 [Paulinella chromatophora]